MTRSADGIAECSCGARPGQACRNRLWRMAREATSTRGERLLVRPNLDDPSLLSLGAGNGPFNVTQPLLRRPAEIPLIVSWIPVSTFSLDARVRCSFRSSTWMWFSGSR